MNPSNDNVTPPEWFNGAASPSPLPPTNQSWKKRMRFILGLIGVMVGILLTVWLVAYLLAPRCLTTDDYTALTGQPYHDKLSPQENFYTYTIDFNENSSQYLTASEAATAENIRRIAKFYQDHESKSIILTLASDYSNTENVTHANQRIATLKTDLLKAGIPEQSIALEQSEQFIPEEDATSTPTATIAITSALECQ